MGALHVEELALPGRLQKVFSKRLRFGSTRANQIAAGAKLFFADLVACDGAFLLAATLVLLEKFYQNDKIY